ncbi:hypothetical protein ACFXMT_33805 [Streptomyces mirabilis]|uniref:hypothetical protein n=1 Tax=Streptomyces mirabilis TaxID=68239 RepID=UPI0036871B33
MESLLYKIVPSQGAEPLLFAATSPTATAGGYYGPRWGMVGPAKPVGLPRPGQGKSAAARLWTEAERLTGVSVTV